MWAQVYELPSYSDVHMCQDLLVLKLDLEAHFALAGPRLHRGEIKQSYVPLNLNNRSLPPASQGQASQTL